jgi:hypothetical protein
MTREEEGEGFSSATRGQRPAGNDSAATGAGGRCHGTPHDF